MDIATLAGIVSAFLLVLISILMGGKLSIFIDIPSVMITVGGTIGVTLINYPLKDVLGVMVVAKNAFFQKNHDTQGLVKKIVDMSSQARKEGLLTLQNTAKSMEDSFMQVGIQALVDGMDDHAFGGVAGERRIKRCRRRETGDCQCAAGFRNLAGRRGWCALPPIRLRSASDGTQSKRDGQRHAGHQRAQLLRSVRRHSLRPLRGSASSAYRASRPSRFSTQSVRFGHN